MADVGQSAVAFSSRCAGRRRGFVSPWLRWTPDDLRKQDKPGIRSQISTNVMVTILG